MIFKLILLCIVSLSAYYWQCFIISGPIYGSEKSLEGKTVVITGKNFYCFLHVFALFRIN